METTQQTNRQFLDYNGLQTLWNGIKEKFASLATVGDIQASIANINASIAELEKTNGEFNNSFNDSLNSIQLTLNQLSPLSANSYNKLMELADSARLGSVIYLKNESESYKAGPYIVTGKGAVAYINTHEGTINPDEADIEAILSDIATLRGEIANITNSYATKEELREAITNIQESNNDAVKIQVVSELPEDGELGTIYLKPNNLNTFDNTFTEYIYVEHDGIKMYEKIGVGLEDLNNYVKSDIFNEKVLKINAAIAAAKSDAISTIQNGIISTDSNSFGNTMSISTSDIEALLNA